jgi:L-histidine N-alpha-methyltransferase
MSAELKQIQRFSTEDDFNEFIHDVATGLNLEKKALPSKYFYDKKGSQLFNKITQHRDYYLTNCELEIIKNHKEKISSILDSEPFNLIEFGPGEGIKTRLLIEQLLEDNHNFTYFTIDISKEYLSQIVDKFNEELPQLKLVALNADYFNGLKWLTKNSPKRNVVLFLGSSIGNFDPQDTHLFLESISKDLNDGDYFLIGFDLRKKIDVLLKAYDDDSGITRQFNFNLLTRMNRELGANFDLNQFDHYATYNVYSGAMESYLISLKDQTVFIKVLNQTFHFNAFEPIHVEYSHKYLLSQLTAYANQHGFTLVEQFFDEKKFFVNLLWRVIK